LEQGGITVAGNIKLILKALSADFYQQSNDLVAIINVMRL